MFDIFSNEKHHFHNEERTTLAFYKTGKSGRVLGVIVREEGFGGS